MATNRFVTILEKDETYDIVKKVEVKLFDKTFVLNRNRLSGKDYSEYRKKILKGEMEEAVLNLIVKAIEHPEKFGASDIMIADPLIYRSLSDAVKMFINLDDDFL